MNYKEAMEFIEKTNLYGSVLGLRTMTELMRRLGNPESKLKVIHIAGTNGKGSTLSFLTSVLMETKEKVGGYTSPSVYQYLEKIKINDKMISKRTFAKYLSKIQGICDTMVKDGFSHPTSFEIETAVAFCYFYDQKCSLVILETGLGGAKDATNVIVQDKICVFTSISIDHQELLGNTLESITKEKVGIITENSVVVVGKNKEVVTKILKDKAKEKNARYKEVLSDKIKITTQSLKKQKFSYRDMKNITIQMSGEYQIENATLALEVVRTLWNEKKWITHEISEAQIKNGFRITNWPGRFSVISQNPIFIVDGAHNEDAAIKLKKTMEIYFTKYHKIYIMGILKDKDYNKIISIMAPYANQIITVSTPNNKRAVPAYDLAQKIQEVNPMVTVADSIEEAVEMAYLLADKETVILAFGSLSYLGKLTEIVNHNEKLLSDSHGKKK